MNTSTNTVAEFKRDEESIVDLLAFVGIEVTVEDVSNWTDEQIGQAEDYAATIKFRQTEENQGEEPSIDAPEVPAFLAEFVKKSPRGFDGKQFDPIELEELAAAVVGIDTWKGEADVEQIELAIADLFGIDLETFGNVASALAPFTIPVQAAISGNLYHGFVADGAFIAKIKVEITA